jgi:hypothetical protein
MPRRPVRGRYASNSNARSRNGNGNAGGGVRTLSLRRLLVSVSGGGGGTEEQKRALRGLLEVCVCVGVFVCLLGVGWVYWSNTHINTQNSLITPPQKTQQQPQSPALPHLTRLIIWDEDETLDAAAVSALQAANPRVHVTVHARLVPAPAL